ncbi:Rieske (2Fe-2S) domain protein [Xylanimonas cellulosilytica DSM 15894]|uniref:Cytochrome bc1 complex Rieske iron-sulfur subunit n=1 Tax=Xylanimonas cellulosilytica (strain DSM 15894 / JCM 12276 / CECT 5975 / KCTC 9989 / LMG 20990 / NBRC 107835 / XIL07) TaxID=446471 RepID=D1BR82_XYLCX|nr:Rieske (2Fe-2S) protein [Xylanimonas cellulosilytica]ACZ30337.1 Rieske (2Fe-2S) domain protein [Xylanimonas cellulosilytica DSM 15894]
MDAHATNAPTRRQVVLSAGAGIAAAGLLAACVEPRATPTADASAVAARGAGTRVAALAEVPVGGALSVDVDGHALLLTRPAEGEVHLFSSICPHAGCKVVPADAELDCPCHGSRFALADGAVLAGPAPAPLAEIAVEIRGDDVVLT